MGMSFENEGKLSEIGLFAVISVLPMTNGVNTTAGYIINGASTTNMTSPTAQFGYDIFAFSY